MNNNNLIQAEKWLTELGVKTVARPTVLLVSRDSMCNLMGGEFYSELLAEMRTAVSTKLFWTCRDDEWMYLDSF